MKRLLVAALTALLAACAAPPVTTPPASSSAAMAPVEVQILAFNDFHGTIVAPPPIEVTAADGAKSLLASGGVARLARALADERRGHRYSITVSAGDLIGASPLVSGAFLDEPTIAAMNLAGLDLNAVGNHEFDKGPRELWRMQAGGCAKFTTLRPCALEPFTGAKFRFLAANVRTAEGVTLFAPTAIRQFGPVRIGFIGLTLQGTASLVSPASSAGLTFTDEAATANALVPELRAAGADSIVLLIHQGGKLPAFTTGQGCDGIDGAILPILDRLDPAIATVVSGHTHFAYVCRRGGRLLTSAGKYGYFYSVLTLAFDPASHRLVAQRAENHVTGTAERGEEPAVRALVDRYVAAAAPVAGRVIGHLAGPAARDDKGGESPAADLAADAFLAAGRSAGAQLALVNGTGVRVALVPGPGGAVTYGQAFAMMPFTNRVVVKTLTGAQLRALLEQQFGAPSYAASPALLVPSKGFSFDYDLSRPKGSRVVAVRLNGRPLSPTARYRVAMNNYLANGGDGYSVMTQGTNAVDAGLDIDALAGWLVKGQAVPPLGRVRDVRR